MNPPDFMLEEVRQAVLAMPIAQTLGVVLRRIDSGHIELEIPMLAAWCYRPGQLQASAIFAAADIAAMAAAGTLLPPGFINATVDATLKLLAPARGSHLVARGRVVKAARLLTVCAADVLAVSDGQETLCATFLGTARNINAADPT